VSTIGHRKRRGVLFLASIGAFAVAVAGSANAHTASPSAVKAKAPLETDTLRVVLTFTPGGHDTDLIAPKALGYFKQEGLDVKVIVPGQTGDAQKLVGTGRADIGVTHASGVILARAQGVPLLGIAARHQQGTNGTLILRKSGITKPKDLEGHTLSITGIPENTLMFNEFLRVNGVDKSKVRVINGGFTGHVLLAKDRVDGNADAISWFESLLVNQLLGRPFLDKSTYRHFQFTKWGVPSILRVRLLHVREVRSNAPKRAEGFSPRMGEGVDVRSEEPGQSGRPCHQRVSGSREVVRARGVESHRADYEER
jgi:ABC-type nitrate/sulfonate/bicarbonate transport system substrate-binding protein